MADLYGSHPLVGEIIKDLPRDKVVLLSKLWPRKEDWVTPSGGARPEISESLLAVSTLREFRDLSERLFLIHKLQENHWNVTQTAQAVDTPRSNLYKKMEQYEIKREEG